MSEDARIVQELQGLLREVPDFPAPGILFRDITPILKDPHAYRGAVQLLAARYEGRGIDVFAGIESRGFLFAAPVALELGAAFVPVRKLGKLPAPRVQRSYALEYGTATLELHRDAVEPGQRVVVMDDLLATGGTAQAACELVEELGGSVEEVAFLVELEFLHGRERLRNRQIASIIRC